MNHTKRRNSRGLTNGLKHEYILTISAFIFAMAGIWAGISALNRIVVKDNVNIPTRSFSGWGGDELDMPLNIALSKNNDLYVLNHRNSHVLKYVLPRKPGGHVDYQGRFLYVDILSRRANTANTAISLCIAGNDLFVLCDGPAIKRYNFTRGNMTEIAVRERIPDCRNLIVHNGYMYLLSRTGLYKLDMNGGILGYLGLKGDNFGIAANGTGNIYVSDSMQGLIKVVTPGLELLRKHRVRFWDKDLDSYPFLAIDSNNIMYCAAQTARKIVIYRLKERGIEYLGEIRYDSSNKPFFEAPGGIAADDKGNIYVTELKSNRIRGLRPSMN